MVDEDVVLLVSYQVLTDFDQVDSGEITHVCLVSALASSSGEILLVLEGVGTSLFFCFCFCFCSCF